MKFSTREDIEAPIEHVWASVTRFKRFERQLLRRGAEVVRADGGRPGLGTEWNVRFQYRGKPRTVEAKITEFDRPHGMNLASQSGGVEGLVSVDLVALSPRRTRLQVGVELTATNLSARLLVQSLKFAKANLSKRFSDRIYEFAQDVEDGYINAG
ncbi:SRPBCC family protein [Psychromarinibacter sp. S121]|uniref:SRPBCC family protein n=1 Tax=Psychromarinibacter sp. S121 TaxID=3415127 RepID=UPI003C7E8F32